MNCRSFQSVTSFHLFTVREGRGAPGLVHVLECAQHSMQSERDDLHVNFWGAVRPLYRKRREFTMKYVSLDMLRFKLPAGVLGPLRTSVLNLDNPHSETAGSSCPILRSPSSEASSNQRAHSEILYRTGTY